MRAAALAGRRILSASVSLLLIAAGCAGTRLAGERDRAAPGAGERPVAEAPATGDSVAPQAAIPGPGPQAADSAAGGQTPTPSDSVAAAAAAAPPDTAGAPAGPPPLESSGDALEGEPQEPWFVDGDQLSGSLEGPIRVEQVRIRHGGLFIEADLGLLDPDQRRAELHGHVMIRDSLRAMTAERGFYYRERALLEMDGDVEGQGPEGEFSADHLRYDRNEERLRLTGSVHLEEPGRSLGSQWLLYEMRDSLVTAGGGVQVIETGDSVEVRGDDLRYDRSSGRAQITSAGSRRPHLTRHFAAGPPFEVESDSLEMWTRRRRGEAFGNVTFERGAVGGRCERIVFEMEDDRVLLLGEPRVDDPDGWVLGDSMAVDLAAGRADRLVVWGGARAEYFPPGRPREGHFTVGDSLIALLEDGAIQTVLVRGDAQALYVPTREDMDEGVGLNWTRAHRLRLLMRASSVRLVQFEGDTEGRYVLPLSPERREALSAGAESSLVAQADSAARAAPRPPRHALPGDSLAARPRAFGHGAFSGDFLAALRRMEAARDLSPSDTLLLSQGFDPDETVRYRGQQIDFDVATDRITINDESWVSYQGMELTAEKILFDSPRSLVRARGEPHLKDSGSEVVGDEMTYRIDNRKGLVFKGRSEFEGGYYRGDRVKRIDQETYFAADADYTSCELEEPHYHFHVDRMKITPGEKALGRPVVLYIGNVPILAIPYAVFPIRSGRQSGILIPDIEFGFDSRRGRFVKNLGYYYAPSDYWDTILWMDYVESAPRVTIWNRTRYNVRYLLRGGLQASYAQDRSRGRSDRWSVDADHDQVLGERFNLKLSARFLSDKDYIEDQEFAAGVDERLNRQLRSQVSLSKSWSGASLSLAADRTENLDESSGSTRISQSAPSLNVNFNTFPLGEKPNERGLGGRLPFLASTYLNAGVRYRGVYRKPWEGASTQNQAAGLSLRLSDKRRPGDVLNVTPNVSISAAWAHKGDQGGRNPVGATWRAGLSLGTTLYGTFFPRLGGLEGVRHVVDLSASYGYSPENRSVEDFPSVGGISLGSSKSSSVSLNMSQRLHLKLGAGEDARKVENLLTWSSSTNYDFLARERAERRAREQGREVDEDEAWAWGDMSHTVRLKPGRLLSNDLSLTHDLKTWTRSRLNINTRVNLSGGGSGGGASAGEDPGLPEVPGEFGSTGGLTIGPDMEPEPGAFTGPWSLSLTHTFSVGREWDTRRSTLNIGTSLNPTRNWQLRYAIYYDLTEQEVTSQSYTLSRDLHCWRLVFDRQMRGGRATYRFLLNVKDLPDIKYERRRN